MSRAIILPEALTRTGAEIECFVSYPGQAQREFEVIERRGGQTVLDVGTQMFLTFDNDVVELVEEKPEPEKAPVPKPKPTVTFKGKDPDRARGKLDVPQADPYKKKTTSKKK